MIGLNKIWTDRGITKATKKRLVSALIFPIATYGCESWTLTKADQSRITSFEMWCWRRMLRISWFMKKSNIIVLEEIQPKRRLLSHVQSQMMKYFGHIARRGGDSLEKVIMQGCVEGRRKPGRPRTRWIDQIKSMVGCPLHELNNLVQDRQRWCDVVAVASCQSWQDRTDRLKAKSLQNGGLSFLFSQQKIEPVTTHKMASYLMVWTYSFQKICLTDPNHCKDCKMTICFNIEIIGTAFDVLQPGYILLSPQKIFVTHRLVLFTLRHIILILSYNQGCVRLDQILSNVPFFQAHPSPCLVFRTF